MTTLPWTRCRYRLAYTIAAAVVAPQRAQAENSVQAAPQAGAADRCSTVLSKQFRRSP
jgi:hypothetical protein